MRLRSDSSFEKFTVTPPQTTLEVTCGRRPSSSCRMRSCLQTRVSGVPRVPFGT
ncbi:MAG: hypothetical protein ACYTFV_18595 [Planctomycetota bacterium]